MRKFYCISICIFFAALLFCSCTVKDKGLMTRTIQKNDLTALIIQDECLIPGDDLEWYMSESEFLSGAYGSKAIDPNSEDFEAHRVGKMQNGWTSYRPLVEIELKNYKTSVSPHYIFNEENNLIAVTYAIMVSSDLVEEYKDMLNCMSTEADDANNLCPSSENFHDLTTEDILTMPIILQWTDTTNGLYFEIDSIHFNDTLVMDLRVSTVNLRGPDTF